MEMKIEWVQMDKQAVPVVRLPEVDTVIAEAVWAMETLQKTVILFWEEAYATDEPALCVDEAVEKDARYQHAQDFLARPDVAAWRERQKEESA